MYRVEISHDALADLRWFKKHENNSSVAPF
jgi:hypothetical protein